MIRFRLERRIDPPRYLSWAVPVASVILALVASGLLLLAFGANPIDTFVAMWDGAFGDVFGGEVYSVSETLVRATPLMLTGLAVAVAFKMKFWNIGAEGQLVMGGIAASAVALFLPDAAPWIPQTLAVYGLIMGGAAILAGALWALIPALLKAYLNVSEIIVTLMLNYVAILWYSQLFTTSWKDPEGFGFPGSALFPEYTWLPRFSNTRVNLALLVGLVAAVGVWVLFAKTRAGYEIRLLGDNPEAARFAGVSVFRNILLVMLISGGLAGLAGMGEVAGISHKLQQGLSANNGFTAIIVAWVAKLQPWAIVLVSVLLAAVFVGGDQIQMTMGLPASVAQVVQGVMLFFVLGGDIFSQYRIRVSRAQLEATA
jgi:simple sugar transport system permease protein